MIQLTIDDNMKTTFIIGKQQIFFDRVCIDAEPGRMPDIKIDGLSMVIDHNEENSQWKIH